MPVPLALVVMMLRLAGAGIFCEASQVEAANVPLLRIGYASNWPLQVPVSNAAWYIRVPLLIEPLLTDAAEAEPACARIALKAFDSCVSSIDGLVTKK